MPNERINLRDRRVIIAVFVLLAGVVILNWRIFQPLRAKHALRHVNGSDVVHLPSDLDEITGLAAMRLAGGPPLMSAAALGCSPGSTVPLPRDPFVEAAPERLEKRPGNGDSTEGLFCSAVILGSPRHRALINGVSCQVGDLVEGYVLEAIRYSGVELSRGRKRIFLSVINPAGEPECHPFVGR